MTVTFDFQMRHPVDILYLYSTSYSECNHIPLVKFSHVVIFLNFRLISNVLRNIFLVKNMRKVQFCFFLNLVFNIIFLRTMPRSHIFTKTWFFQWEHNGSLRLIENFTVNGLIRYITCTHTTCIIIFLLFLSKRTIYIPL